MTTEATEAVIAPRGKLSLAPVAAGGRLSFASGNWRLILPTVSAGSSLLLHHLLRDSQASQPTHYYPAVLIAALFLSPLLGLLCRISVAWKVWAIHIAPILAAALVLFCTWDLITLKFALLPLPYFPGPEAVFSSFADDWKTLLDSAWHSLILLMSGYVIGVVSGLISGVMIGWSPRARYWGMPLLKVLGPVPATAWIPLALELCPTAYVAGVVLIALAVWFPVTMLCSSGISNVRVSHLEVARTLGASRRFLIFNVAIPSALPNIFVGLFMGLGAAFLTLVVAEMLGVKSGLGWYVDWARAYTEYGKVYAALLVTIAFFSTLMTLLFMLRDRVLVWQKGVIKW